MKKTNQPPIGPYHQEYFNFFLQLPAIDYLDDIKTQDPEQPRDLTVYGLSDEQVSQLALDSLRDARSPRKPRPDNSKSTPPHNTD